MNAGVVREHEFDAAPGLPEALPAGERLLWQGHPDWRMVARDALHGRKLALYFAVLLVWRGAAAAADGGGPGEVAHAVALGLPLAALALALVLLLAWLIARTATYTITDRRVVMSIGVVLSVSFNLPLAQIAGADLRLRHDGSGDIALALAGDQHIAWLHLWPHVRPWRLKRSQPMLRGLADAQTVAALLAQAARSAGVAGAR